MPIDTSLFTPRISHTSAERIRMSLSPEDKAKTGRGQWSAEVTDQNTGIRYKVESAPCGLRCHCDAVIVETLG